jgi:PHD/YefM family antitoxin component YafN of YafNO toxin-antitoxin module
MITVKMTKAEYEAYLLYLKSIEVMRNAKKGESENSLLDEYLSDPVNVKEIEAGLEDIKAGRISYIDPDNLWESIK